MPVTATKIDNLEPFCCLVVDDEEAIREFIGFYLESSLNLKVDYGASGNEAIAQIKANPNKYSFVVCDFNMPEGTGGSVFQYICDNKIQLPFILCTANSPHFHPEFNLGKIYGHIEKPNIREPLLKYVTEIIETKKLSL